MLGDAANSYNPIIQAMIATANLKQRGQAQEAEKEQQKNELALKKDALKQASDQFKQEHEIREKASELAQKHFQLQSDQHNLMKEVEHVKMLGDASKFVQGGGDANKIPGIQQILGLQQVEQAQPQNFSPAAGASRVAPQIDINKALFDPQVAIQRKAAEEAAVIKAKGEATEPFVIRAAARDLEDKKQIEKYRATLEKTDKQLDRESHERIARITADSRVKNPAIDPATFQSLFKLKALGQIKLNPANPTHMAVLSALEEQGANVDFDSKDTDAIKETNKLEPIFSDMEKFSKQLSENRLGALGQGALAKGTEFVGGSSKLLNDWKILRNRAVVIGRALEGMTGRPLAAQLSADLKSLPEAGITKQDAQDRIDALRNLAKGVESSLFAGMPEWQEKMARQHYQVVPLKSQPEWLKMAPKTNKKGHKLDDAESVKAGHPVYGEQ